MSFLKQILKPFVEFDEDIQKKDEEKGNASPPSQQSPERVHDIPLPYNESTHPLIDAVKMEKSNVDVIPTYSPTGTLDKPLPEHIEYFEKLIEHANANNPAFTGADYKEFIENKLDIDDITDEGIKYRTAYNILKGSGLTKAKLLQTGNLYVDLIGRDLNNFQGAQAMKYRKEIGPKEEEIEKKAGELKALLEKVNKLKGEINSLTQEVNVAREKMNTARSSFLLAGELKQKEIAAELNKIDQYFDR